METANRPAFDLTHVYYRGIELYLDTDFVAVNGIEEGYQFQSEAEWFAMYRRQEEFRKRKQNNKNSLVTK